MDRRSYLATVSASLAVSGCLEALGGDRDTATDTGAPTGETSTHDLYVENFDAVRYTAAVAVRDLADDTVVLDATYEVPDERGFYVPDVLETDRTYEISIDLTDGPAETVEQAVGPCNGEGDSQNVGAWIRDSDVTYHQDNCDEIRVGVDLEYADHERFVVE